MQFEPKPSYNLEELLICAKGELFPSGLPRLPLPPMLMFDRFTLVSKEGGAYGKGIMKAELDIKPDLWFFDCHFYNDPVMPGCLGVDALWQMLGFYIGWMGNSGKGRALGAGEIKFTDQVLKDAGTIEYQLDIKRIMSRKLAFGLADGTLTCKDEVIYTCKDLRVGLFND